MADITFPASHRIAVNNLVREWDSNQPKDGLLRISMLPVEGHTADGRITLLGVPEPILSLLMKRGIPFERSSN